MSLFWLSFADAGRPEGQQFLGVVLVESPNLRQAIARTHLLGCNPGGGVLTLEVHDGAERVLARLREAPRDTLLSFAQLAELGLEPSMTEGLG